MAEEVRDSVRVLMTRLQEHDSKRSELMSQLKASLAITELWPQAFKDGPVTCRIQGSHSNGFRLYIKSFCDEKYFPLFEIPVELACREHIKKALKAIVNERCGKSDAKRQAEALLHKLWEEGL